MRYVPRSRFPMSASKRVARFGDQRSNVRRSLTPITAGTRPAWSRAKSSPWLRSSLDTSASSRPAVTVRGGEHAQGPIWDGEYAGWQVGADRGEAPVGG